MKTLIKYRVTKANPALAQHGKYFNVQIWTDTGRGFIYCGCGRFCTTLQEVIAYITKDKKERKAL